MRDDVEAQILGLAFSAAARHIGERFHAAGLPVPGFRTPPKNPDVDRSLRRRPAGTVVAVRVRGRRPDDWLADMVDGALASVAGDPGLGLVDREVLLAEVRAGFGEPNK